MFDLAAHPIPATAPGAVTFVGAGPGDPEHLTLKALRALQQAEVVIHDRLVGAGVLALANPLARLIDVGKHGFGPSTAQADIDALIDKAGVELDRPKRIAMMTEALMILKRENLFIPLHQQPMAWAMRNTVSSMVQASDNKPRLWLTQLK